MKSGTQKILGSLKEMLKFELIPQLGREVIAGSVEWLIGNQKNLLNILPHLLMVVIILMKES